MRRARCGENRTPGSAGGPRKRTGSNPDTAPRVDPTRFSCRRGSIGLRSNMISSRSFAAPTEAAASAAFEDLADRWGKQYPAIIRLWNNAWQEFIPFLDYDTEIRRVLCSTNAIESLNAGCRRAVKARGHFPTEAAALKCFDLVTRSLDPTGKGQARWITRWKPALNAFAITFADRWPGSETY